MVKKWQIFVLMILLIPTMVNAQKDEEYLQTMIVDSEILDSVSIYTEGAEWQIIPSENGNIVLKVTAEKNFEPLQVKTVGEKNMVFKNRFLPDIKAKVSLQIPSNISLNFYGVTAKLAIENYQSKQLVCYLNQGEIKAEGIQAGSSFFYLKNGDLFVQDLEGTIKIKHGVGKIAVNVPAWPAKNDIWIKSKKGDVSLTMPKNAVLALDFLATKLELDEVFKIKIKEFLGMNRIIGLVNVKKDEEQQKENASLVKIETGGCLQLMSYEGKEEVV